MAVLRYLTLATVLLVSARPSAFDARLERQ
jgi:hypothetical protein